MVPQAQLYDTRLTVAGAGLPAGSEAGYALLDDMSITSSEFQQQVTYQRALEGELAKTIGEMEGVASASVKARPAGGDRLCLPGGGAHRVGLYPDRAVHLAWHLQHPVHRAPRLRVR
ncbi:hypothetical protein [Demequina litorisediminis]|uniref:Flagellar M-ring N-terminal domain-containing protein n=1 Tax=Demequina litorisediminis TaxID=1849022 RepID=A0ABQ6ICU9_9MICO|nr:hypothetical protein [Demequina litorisediminis]GMA35663.1 hypothetical protein GCM10025876_18670 [Demequina litorisediminis]